MTPNGAGGEAVEYHHPDRLGTRIITNPSTGGSSEQVTLPFGTALAAESSGSPSKRRFTSYERNSATGLDYAVNRHYDAQQGRFTQVDPIGMGDAGLTTPQSFNLYAYVQNDPVNLVDPTGLYWAVACSWWALFDVTDAEHPIQISEPYLRCSWYWVPDAPYFGGDPGGGGPGGDTVPNDLRDRVQDITGNCSEFLGDFLDALSKSGKVFSNDFGKLLDRIKKVDTASPELFAKNGAPANATGMALGSGDNRQIYILSNQTTATTAARDPQFRWNAIGQITVAELLHHAKSDGRFSDKELDKAALSLLTGKELDKAKSEMKSDKYQAGTVGHRAVKERCKPTNPNGPPPSR